MSQTTNVLDMSHWQPTPDFPTIKAAGIVGVILKCTEGTTNVDKTSKQRRKDAIAAGLGVSSYHFMRAGSMARQMEHYLNILEPRTGERVILDHEDEAVSLDKLKEAVQILQADTRNLQVSIYSGHLIKQQLGGRRDVLLATTSLWIAHYTQASQPTWPIATWPSWSLWQFTDKGSIAGVTGNVDCNKFNGSDAACRVWLGPIGAAGTTPLPEPAPPVEDPDTIVMDLTFPQESKLRIKVNGIYWMPNPQQ
jgi:lysozyme